MVRHHAQVRWRGNPAPLQSVRQPGASSAGRRGLRAHPRPVGRARRDHRAGPPARRAAPPRHPAAPANRLRGAPCRGWRRPWCSRRASHAPALRPVPCRSPRSATATRRRRLRRTSTAAQPSGPRRAVAPDRPGRARQWWNARHLPYRHPTSRSPRNAGSRRGPAGRAGLRSGRRGLCAGSGWRRRATTSRRPHPLRWPAARSPCPGGPHGHRSAGTPYPVSSRAVAALVTITPRAVASARRSLSKSARACCGSSPASSASG